MSIVSVFRIVLVRKGDDTKTRLNTAAATSKTSKMQAILNTLIRGLVVCVLVFVAYEATMAVTWGDDDVDRWPLRWIQFLLILNWVIPLSMYVVFEMLKFIIAHNLNRDHQMFYPSEALWKGSQRGSTSLVSSRVSVVGGVTLRRELSGICLRVWCRVGETFRSCNS